MFSWRYKDADVDTRKLQVSAWRFCGQYTYWRRLVPVRMNTPVHFYIRSVQWLFPKVNTDCLLLYTVNIYIYDENFVRQMIAITYVSDLADGTRYIYNNDWWRSCNVILSISKICIRLFILITVAYLLFIKSVMWQFLIFGWFYLHLITVNALFVIQKELMSE